MTAFTPGQPVTVHIGGIDNDPTGHEFTYHSTDGKGWINVHGFHYLFAYPADWVVPVTPPCPWTEVGTLVAYGRPAANYQLAVLGADGWECPVTQNELNWSDIAPHNPRRLVPEQPARKALRDEDDYIRTWWPVEGTDRYASSRDYVSTLAEIEGRYGPVTEVDDPEVTS